ncbi:uncharacterized protein PPP1R15 [Planococcus citri]|uniref:uncharacterized protein PPP1R15 n=1 Tax=Planococcus citri TaxID=170843 RepID=UPI0031F87841
MRRRNRKHRKSIHQESHPRTIATKGSNADDTSCNRNLRHFTAKSEPITSCQFNLIVKNKKTPKKDSKNKEKRNAKTKKEPITDWLDNNMLENNITMSFPSSKGSTEWYFIPLNCYCDINENDDFNNFMENNIFMYYGSNSSSMISRYNNNRRKNITHDKSMVLEFPQLRKSRSSSESSINSDDSFICFEITDDYDDHDEIRYVDDIADKNYPADTSNIPLDTPDTSSKKRKRVRFADNSQLATVHLIIAWDFAYRAARISPWEMVARDANRFQSKIRSIEPIIAPVLDPVHRSKIWHERMEKFYK